MKNDRHIKVTNLLKELAATFVRQEANSNPLITVTNVDLSPDMRRAIIFVTTIPDGKEQEALIFLKRNGTNLRTFIKQKGRFKTIPHLEFMVDAGEKHRQHMDDLVRQLEEEKHPKDSDQ